MGSGVLGVRRRTDVQSPYGLLPVCFPTQYHIFTIVAPPALINSSGGGDNYSDTGEEETL
jgi:hypothetical protein